MRWLNTLPIRRKLTVSILLVSNLASLLACAVFGAYDWVTYRQAMVRDLTTLGGVMANNSTAAITFQDADTAQEVLRGLRVHPHIVAAALYGREGHLFAAYVRGGAPVATPPVARYEGTRFEPGRLVSFLPVELDAKRIGTIYLESDLRALQARLRLYASIVLLVLMSSLLMTLMLSAVFQHAISQPILELAQAARRISQDRDYALRVAKSSKDEVGQLTDSFNEMLSGIGARDSALRHANAALQGEIGERCKAEAELRQLNETLEQRVSDRTAVAEQASRAKSDFLASMSHELRTPLNSVIGFANLLLKNKGGNLRSEDLAFIERIHANGRHLLGLINQILDLSKIEAGRVELQVAPLDLGRMLDALVAGFEGQLHGRDVRLVTAVPRGMASLDADAEKLRQVLINLIGNAIKFTEQGTVTVRVRIDAITRQATRIDVIDTGIGIARDKQELIFEAFRQADSSTGRQFGGTGLGLTISQTLCRLMGYRIEVESEEGRGSRFSIVLAPTAALSGEPAEPLASPDTSRHAEPSRRLVLVVDDEEDARLLLSRMIEEFGYRVVPAGSGEECLRLAQGIRPDVITLDLIMPAMDGWNVMRRLKEDPELAGIPTVIVSVVGSENRGTVLGAVDVLQKPVSREDLRRVLQHCSQPRILVVDDSEDDRRILQAILEREPVQLRFAADGHEALQVLEQFTPDVILLDLFMPNMDGMRFMDVLRHRPGGEAIPLVVITSTSPDAEVRRCLGQWTRAVLDKQADLPEQLRRVLDGLLGRNEAPATPVASRTLAQ
jgi:signal transduction histidine kinase/CheY-like chemotaxis protein